MKAKSEIPKQAIPCPHCGYAIDARFPHLPRWIPQELLLACPACRQMFRISAKDLRAARSDLFRDYIATPVLYFCVAMAGVLAVCCVLLYFFTSH